MRPNYIETNILFCRASFTDILDAEICDSQPISLTPSIDNHDKWSAPGTNIAGDIQNPSRPCKGTGQLGEFRSTEEICKFKL